MAELKKEKLESRRVLAFNTRRKLSAIYASRLQASHALDCRSQLINNACDGQRITLQGVYLRWWDPSIEINVFEELGQLSIEEYDELLGLERSYVKPKRPTKKPAPKTNRRINRKSNGN